MKRVAINRGVWLALALCVMACEEDHSSTFSFYDERISPILDVGCQRQTTGCHVDDGRGFALGNLDLGSYERLVQRADLLSAYGPYPVPALLLKVGGPVAIDVRTIDPPDPTQPERRRVRVHTDIRHGGGQGGLSQGSRDYAALKQWLDGGYRRSGVPEVALRESSGKCVDDMPPLPGIDVSGAPRDPKSYARFVDDVQPILTERCAGSACHGVKIADLHLTCGKTDAQRRYNYEVALAHLDEIAASSELLRRPLSQLAGGSYHEGGDVFKDARDKDYRTLLAWAEDIAERAPQLLEFGEADDGLRYFGNRVQPVLVAKGCMMQNCHSPAMFHDLRLRGGSQGALSHIATRRNYEMSRHNLAIDSADPNQSRLIAKNLCPPNAGGGGVQHRGGALFEDFGGCAEEELQASADKCAGLDLDAGNLDEIPAYCVLVRWHELERELAIERGEIGDAVDAEGIVMVTRPPGVGGVLGFDEFRPGADLVFASVASGGAMGLELGATRSLLGACGLAADVDIRGIDVSWEGDRIAFAARTRADAPLRLYEVRSDGSACGPVVGLAAAGDEVDGILLHDFDPAYAPDGRLVFASTRGNLDGAASDRGPTRTPAALTPNANLYIFDAGATPPVRQLTYLSNQELSPSFMSDGRLIFTTEKRAQDFHQLATRRINLDGGDYHPLFAQRESIGFESATEVVELPNRNLALVAASLDAADGGGAIAVVNRSIGPDQDDRDPRDRAYVHSLTVPAEGAFGGGAGVFRAPTPLPSGMLLAACDMSATSLTDGPYAYGLCEIDPAGRRAPRQVLALNARAIVQARAVWRRHARPVFTSKVDEVNGSTYVVPGQDDAVVHVVDAPLLATLLFENKRTKRRIDPDIEVIEFFESMPAPASATSFDTLGDSVVEDAYGRFYEEIRSLGRARAERDGSLRVRLPGGVPIRLQLADGDGAALRFGKGAPFTGRMLQREEMQFYPGERAKQSMPRRLFNGVCGGCHGSISGRELDVVVDVDVLTSASQTLADDEPRDLR